MFKSKKSKIIVTLTLLIPTLIMSIFIYQNYQRLQLSEKLVNDNKQIVEFLDYLENNRSVVEKYLSKYANDFCFISESYDEFKVHDLKDGDGFDKRYEPANYAFDLTTQYWVFTNDENALTNKICSWTNKSVENNMKKDLFSLLNKFKNENETYYKFITDYDYIMAISEYDQQQHTLTDQEMKDIEKYINPQD